MIGAGAGTANGCTAHQMTTLFGPSWHGHYLPQGPNWTEADLVSNVDAAHELTLDPSGLDLDEIARVAGLLEAVTRDQLRSILIAVPSEWGVPNDDLEAVGFFSRDGRRLSRGKDARHRRETSSAMRYCYSLIRFVPDPVRGEFVNVGAIVGSEESSEWGVRQVDNPLRARHLDERGTLPAVFAFIDSVGREIDAYEEIIERGGTGGSDFALSEEWLTSLHRGHTNIVQLSEPLPVLAESLDEAVETIVFAQLIVVRRSGPGDRRSTQR